MHFHNLSARTRIVAPGGPVASAVRRMRAAHAPHPLLSEQFDAESREIEKLRETIRRQIEADYDRIDRCLVLLNAIDGDPDLEPSLAGGPMPGESDDRELDAGDEPEVENEHADDADTEAWRQPPRLDNLHQLRDYRP